MTRRLILVAALFAGTAVPVAAQTSGDGPPATARVRFGPLWLNPAISLTNIGVDNNVFNEPQQAAPKKDFTFTVSPGTDIWLHMGRTWLTGILKEDVVWYQKYASERSGNDTYGVGWKVPARLTPFSVNATRTNSRARAGFEIDARAQQSTTTYTGTGELRFLSRTYVGATASYMKLDFADGATFLGTNLHDALNHRTLTTGATVRSQLTALTNLTFAATRATDRFEFTPLRNSTSTSLLGGVAFDPAALLKGSANFGYTRFKPDDPALPGYRGTTGDLNLSYAFQGITKIVASATRGVNYSYDITQPYYILTGANLGVAQQVFGPVDLAGTIGRQRLAYQDRAGVAVAVANRVDYVRSYSGSVGFHLGQDLRLGFNVGTSSRTSELAVRQYDGVRYGVSLTYGIFTTGFSPQ